MAAMASSRPAPGAHATPGPGSTSVVLEFLCLFTHDLRRKQKRWQDGRLKYHTFNKRIMVYDDRGTFMGDMHWRADWEFNEGEEVQLERGGIIVQVAECVGRQTQDLSELIDKRWEEKEQRQARAAARPRHANAVQHHPATPRGQQPQADHFQLRHRPLNEVVGTPTGHYGRALVPSDSPFERRQRDLDLQRNQGSQNDQHPSKKRRYEAPAPSKSGYAQSLFGATLTLSGVPSSSFRRQPVQRRVDHGDDPSSSPPVLAREENPIRGQRPDTSSHQVHVIDLSEVEDSRNDDSSRLVHAEPSKRLRFGLTRPISSDGTNHARTDNLRPNVNQSATKSQSLPYPQPPKRKISPDQEPRMDEHRNTVKPVQEKSRYFETERRVSDQDKQPAKRKKMSPTAAEILDEEIEEPEVIVVEDNDPPDSPKVQQEDEPKTVLRLISPPKRGLVMISEAYARTKTKTRKPERSREPSEEEPIAIPDLDLPTRDSPPISLVVEEQAQNSKATSPEIIASPTLIEAHGGTTTLNRGLSPEILDKAPKTASGDAEGDTRPEDRHDKPNGSTYDMPADTESTEKDSRPADIQDKDDVSTNDVPADVEDEMIHNKVDSPHSDTEEDIPVVRSRSRRTNRQVTKSPAPDEPVSRPKAKPTRTRQRNSREPSSDSEDDPLAFCRDGEDSEDSDEYQPRPEPEPEPQLRKHDDDPPQAQQGPRLAKIGGKGIKSKEVIGFVVKDPQLLSRLNKARFGFEAPVSMNAAATASRELPVGPDTRKSGKDEGKQEVAKNHMPGVALQASVAITDRITDRPFQRNLSAPGVDVGKEAENDTLAVTEAGESRVSGSPPKCHNLDLTLEKGLQSLQRSTTLDETPAPVPGPREAAQQQPGEMAASAPALAPAPSHAALNQADTMTVRKSTGQENPEESALSSTRGHISTAGTNDSATNLESMNEARACDGNGTTPAGEAPPPLAKPPPRLQNPATRGRKAALKAHAAGQAPQPILPPPPPGPALAASEQLRQHRAPPAMLTEDVQPEPAATTERPRYRMTFPGFVSANNGGPWSREAYDLFERGRPG